MSAALSQPPFHLTHLRDDRQPAGTRHTVVVSDGLIGVNRVVSLLRQRRYEVLSITAEVLPVDPRGGMRLTVVVASRSGREAALLDQRLLRLPSVLAVRTDTM